MSFVGFTTEREKPSFSRYRPHFSQYKIDKTLMYLGKNVSKVEDKLLYNSPDSDFIYFQILYFLHEDCWNIGPKDLDKFEEKFMFAMLVKMQKIEFNRLRNYFI